MPAENSSIWTRLRQNQEANAPAFRSACIEMHDIAVLRCPACDLEESALFWSPVALGRRTLHFCCPLCGHGGARYNLRRNRGRSPLNGRRVLAAVLFALLLAGGSGWAFVRWAPPQDDLRFTLQRGWHQVTSAPAAARGWLAAVVTDVRSNR
jgi:hypothetical protein